MKHNINTAIATWNGPLGLPEFERIDDRDFERAFTVALTAHLADIEAINANPEPPSFENTIVTLEASGELLRRVSSIFWNLAGADTNDTLQTLERNLSPLLSRHYSTIMMNRDLFARIDTLYRTRDTNSLDSEANRVLELTWKSFTRLGANLDDQTQERLARINERLATLSTAFSQNVLADERDYALFLEKTDAFAGLPKSLIASMRVAAQERGQSGKCAVTLSRSIIEPFLTFSERRDLRETVFKAWIARGESNVAHDNRPIVAEMVGLRAEKAALLGYESDAHYKLDDTMARTPGSVRSLLETVWEKASARATEEAAALAEFIIQEGHNHEVAPWDWRYYSERVRAARYEFSEEEVKPYLQLEKVIDAAFDTAKRLFGVTFRKHNDVNAYHPDVQCVEMLAADGKRAAIFLGDYFSRPSKRSGAWMSSFQVQHRLEGCGSAQIPIVVNVANFAKAPKDEPVLITMDDARTLFHEFGHALHGMLSNVTYPSISGTSVSRDFVELPSQLFEHWLTVPEVLQRFAVHHETGKPIPQTLLNKMYAAEKHNKGFFNVEFTASALVDMAFHELSPLEANQIDPMSFQGKTLDRLGMPSSIVMRHATPNFAHIFAGDGYSAGYYSYLWSGVLDADAFQAFSEKSNPFDRDTAERLLRFVYASGGSMDPESAYIAFRSKLPTPDALLIREGLI